MTGTWDPNACSAWTNQLSKIQRMCRVDIRATTLSFCLANTSVIKEIRPLSRLSLRLTKKPVLSLQDFGVSGSFQCRNMGCANELRWCLCDESCRNLPSTQENKVMNRNNEEADKRMIHVRKNSAHLKCHKQNSGTSSN